LTHRTRRKTHSIQITSHAEEDNSMLTYAVLRNDAPRFEKLAGITVAEFESLYTQFEPAWKQAEASRLGRPLRKRAIGGGSHYTLDLQTQLLMVVVFLHLSLTTEATGKIFGVHKSTISRNERRILPVLHQITEGVRVWPAPPTRGRGNRLVRVLHDFPELAVVVQQA
jgi:hypothetical protein